MNATGNEDRDKTAVEEVVNLKIPKQVLDFADFYADIGGTDRDALLTEIVIERLGEIKEQFKTLPHLHIPELW